MQALSYLLKRSETYVTKVLCSQVQNLIERCIIFRMGRDDCMRTLAKHANIDPVVTFTGYLLTYLLYYILCIDIAY